MQLGGRIRALRKSKSPKMTSSELAKKADISQSYVIEIESGKKNPSLEVLFRLATALGVSLPEIISGTSPFKERNISYAADFFPSIVKGL